MNTSIARVAIAFCLAQSVAACGSSTSTGNPKGIQQSNQRGSLAPDAGLSATPTLEACKTAPRAVDLLLVVDDSPSMKEEQANLIAQLPRLARALATGDRDGDGQLDFAPVESLHVAVTNVNMGANGVASIENCGGLGNDGLFLRGDAGDPLCARLPSLPLVQTYAAPADPSDREQAADDFAAQVACAADVGTHGCGFEHQLEAGWKALAPRADMSFSAGTGGHGDAENAGFLRDDALLAVLIISDEDDCSVPDASRELFNASTTDPRFAGQNLNVRCGLHVDEPGVMQPVDRYIEGFRSLKPNHPERVIFGAIAGLPSGAESMVDASGAQDFDALLALPEMTYRADRDPKDPKAIGSAACESLNGRADPGRRYVEVAKGFGASGFVRSICDADFAPALDHLTDMMGRELAGAACAE